MFTRLVPAAVAVVAIGWLVSAQPAGDEKPGGGQPAPGTKGDGKLDKDAATFEIRLADDTVMKVTLLEQTVSVTTKYGKLNIPAAEVRRLEFGFRYPEGMEEKITKAIGELGSPEFRTREAAEQTLANCEHFAIPALRRAVKGEDPEVVRRAQAVLKLLEAKLTPDKLELRDYDVVEAAEFTVRGRIELSALKVRTKFFGDVTVKLTDIRSFRSVGSAAGGAFTLDAGKYAKMNQADWMETTIEVTAGQQLEVTATGKVDQWPQAPGAYMVEPGGLPGYATGGALPGGGQRIGVPGQLVGRIGAKGTPFALGASYKGKVTENGKLYLRISPSPWNCDSTGSYKVIVNITTP
ncbi:MAG: hypothetical protein L0241_00420 [Planctomycetia bacterium]|nr:hypothetical protein [Planctomycetia bacterium]